MEKKKIIQYNAEYLTTTQLGIIRLMLEPEPGVDKGEVITLPKLKADDYRAIVATLLYIDEGKLFWEPNYKAVAIVNW